MVVAQHALATSTADKDKNRRISFLDDAGELAPGQLYSTESGRYFPAPNQLTKQTLPRRQNSHHNRSPSHPLSITQTNTKLVSPLEEKPISPSL